MRKFDILLVLNLQYNSSYEIINETIEANEILPELWYPKGHMPELIREWPLTEDVEIPNPFAASPENKKYRAMIKKPFPNRALLNEPPIKRSLNT